MANILVVEDDLLVLETLISALEHRGHTVARALNGLQGLQRFCEQKFDLVITDIIMPKEEGLGMILKMRTQDPDVKIVAISGGGRTGNVEFLRMAEGLGAMATIDKPVRLATLFDVLDRCLDTHAVASASP